MKALSIKQPWASLIAHGIKDIENRTWRTNFRGKIYIHASAKKADLNVMKILYGKNLLGDISEEQYRFLLNDDTRSAIIGEVEIIDCVINHDSIWAEKTEYFGKTCKENKCPEFIQWDIEGGSCESCKLGGQSYYVEQIPKKCLHKEKMPKPIYNWVLANPVLYKKPVLNVKGKLSFWEYECNHQNVSLSDGLLECQDCGLRNY